MSPLALLLRFTRLGYFSSDAAIVLGATEPDLEALEASGAVVRRAGICWVQPGAPSLLRAYLAERKAAALASH